MRFESVKQIALYYKEIPGMIRLLRQEREGLEEEYNCLRGAGNDGMPRGSSPGKPTESLGLLAAETGVGERLNEIKGKEKLLMDDEARIRGCLDALNGRYKQVIVLRYETGMPIGNLTSQLFANIYLNELDQFCKHKLKIHYYIRYMDDVIILGPNKWVLREWKEEIEKFLEKELHLDLNTKTSIRPMKSGIEFVGVRIWPTHMKLRKSTVRRIKRETRKISRLYASGDMARDAFERRVTSIRGMLKHAECASLRWRLNEIYREEMERAKNKKKEVEYEPFADHSGAGERNGNSGECY